MTLTFALMLAADSYRNGDYSADYAHQQIEEIRALVREYMPANTWLADIMIPSTALTYAISEDEFAG